MKTFDKIILVIGTIWFIWLVGSVIEIAAEEFRKPSYSYYVYSPSYSSSYGSGNSYSSSSRYSSGSSSSSTGKATPTPASKSRSTSSSKKTGSTASRTYRDPDDYMDVEGYYYDNRSDFENEDDAWDYLDDDWDDWD